MVRKKLSIIVPSFNEAKTLPKVIRKLQKVECYGLRKEIIVVNDGSTDNTQQILKKINKNIHVINHAINLGKGASLKSGIKRSTGDYVIFQDADLEYDPADYVLMLEPLVLEKADVVYGSRFMGGRPHRVVYYWHSVINKILTTISNMFTNINLTDMETGSKCFKGNIIRSIEPYLVSNRFGIEPEITARLSKIKHIRFYEVGISYYGRTYEEGKHINWVDGLAALWHIIWFNITIR